MISTYSNREPSDELEYSWHTHSLRTQEAREIVTEKKTLIFSCSFTFGSSPSPTNIGSQGQSCQNSQHNLSAISPGQPVNVLQSQLSVSSHAHHGGGSGVGGATSPAPNGGSGSSSTHERTLFLTFVSLNLLFLLCQTPRIAMNFHEFGIQDLKAFCKASKIPYKDANWVVFGSGLEKICLILNSAVNFIVYFVFGKTYREQMRRSLLGPFGRCLKKAGINVDLTMGTNETTVPDLESRLHTGYSSRRHVSIDFMSFDEPFNFADHRGDLLQPQKVIPEVSEPEDSSKDSKAIEDHLLTEVLVEATPKDDEADNEDDEGKDEVFVKDDDDDVLSVGSCGSVRSNCSICLARMNEQDDDEDDGSSSYEDEDGYTSGSCSGSCDSRCSFNARSCAECAQCDAQDARTSALNGAKETVHHLRAQVQVQRCSADQLNLLSPGAAQGEGLRRSLASTASLGVYDITINWISEGEGEHHHPGGRAPTRRFASMAILAPPSPTSAAPTAAAAANAGKRAAARGGHLQQPIETAVSLLTVNDVSAPMATTMKRSGSLRVHGSEKVAGEHPYNRPISPVFV